MALYKFVDSSFPQYNVHTGVHGGCLAFTPLDGYLKLWELFFLKLIRFIVQKKSKSQVSSTAMLHSTV